MKKIICIIILSVTLILPSSAQNNMVIDEIIATVGDHIITRSDLEYAIQAYKYSSGFYTMEADSGTICSILEQLLFQKLLVHQAELDSTVITDQQVEDRLDYNLKVQIMRMGGDTKKLEEYYGKSLTEIKADSRDQLREDMLAEETQRSITSNIKVITQEVKDYFNNIPDDSLPIIPTEYEIAHIVKTPVISDAEKISIKEKLEEFRSRALKGENFSTFARMYSEDPGSAGKGGDIGFTSRGELYPEFEAAAYSLRPGEISSVVETEAGYHIIKMLERRGESIHVAHILIKPKPSVESLMEAKNYLDSIYTLMSQNNIAFADAAKDYSDDPSKISGGKIVNPYSSSHAFLEEQLMEYDKTAMYAIENLQEGQYTRPLATITEAGNQAYHIVCLIAKREAHVANMIDDYEKIKNAALEDKKQKTLLKWINNKVKYTHIRLADEFNNCEFLNDWGIK
ncbi:MAG: peptidylprolyl isomerase [Bacteroidales bacterium]|nr:peptidylprolyl isomerase [Bacteroidales bacterium]